MLPETDGVGVLDVADFGPYKIWSADKWKCPKCGIEIVIGFGDEAIAEHYQTDHFDHVVKHYRERGLLTECRS